MLYQSSCLNWKLLLMSRIKLLVLIWEKFYQSLFYFRFYGFRELRLRDTRVLIFMYQQREKSSTRKNGKDGIDVYSCFSVFVDIFRIFGNILVIIFRIATQITEKQLLLSCFKSTDICPEIACYYLRWLSYSPMDCTFSYCFRFSSSGNTHYVDNFSSSLLRYGLSHKTRQQSKKTENCQFWATFLTSFLVMQQWQPNVSCWIRWTMSGLLILKYLSMVTQCLASTFFQHYSWQ